jgi:hypothetical protein
MTFDENVPIGHKKSGIKARKPICKENLGSNLNVNEKYR